MTAVYFTKMQGAGNDFVLIDNWAGAFPEARKKEFVVAACKRAVGIGADGVIFLENDHEYQARWDFYNADGSSAEMCGNGARCFAVFARDCGVFSVGKFVFRSIAGAIEAEISAAGRARVKLTDAPLPVKTPSLTIGGQGQELYFINTGVPHAILPVADLEAVEVRKWGAEIRYHAHFAPKGTNANFIVKCGNEILIRTYERGVEDETLACGTGSVAAAIVAGELFGMQSPVAVRTRSGDTLNIAYERNAAGIRNVYLEGPAVTVFTGQIDF